MKPREEENREAEAIRRAWLLLADPDFLNGEQILVKLPYGWAAQPWQLSGCSGGRPPGWFQVAGEARAGGFWCFPAVVGDQPAQYPNGNDFAAGVFIGFDFWIRIWNSIEALMTPRPIKIFKIIFERPPKMFFIPKNKVAQQFCSDRFNQAFAECIRFRGSVGNWQAFYAHDVVQPFVQVAAEFAAFSFPIPSPNGLFIATRQHIFGLLPSPTLVVLAENLVVVVDEIFGVNLPGRHFTKLLLDEIQRGVGRDAEAHDLAGLKVHDDEDVNDLKVDQVLLEEVAAQHTFFVLRQKGPPRLAGVGGSVAGDVLCNGHGGMGNTQLEPHLVGDVLSAPGGVVPGYLANEGDIFIGNWWAATSLGFGSGLAFTPPEFNKKVVMPALDGSWVIDQKGAFPLFPKPEQKSPEQAVSRFGNQPFTSQLFQLISLLLDGVTKRGVLQAQIGRGLETGPEDCGQLRQTTDQAQKGVEGHGETSQWSEKTCVTILHGLPDEGARKPLKCPPGVNKWGAGMGKNGSQRGPHPARVNFRKPLQNSLGYIYCGAWQSTRTAKTGGPSPDVPASLSQSQRKAA